MITNNLYAVSTNTLRSVRHELVQALNDCSEALERNPAHLGLHERFTCLVDDILTVAKEIHGRQD